MHTTDLDEYLAEQQGVTLYHFQRILEAVVYPRVPPKSQIQHLLKWRVARTNSVLGPQERIGYWAMTERNHPADCGASCGRVLGGDIDWTKKAAEEQTVYPSLSV